MSMRLYEVAAVVERLLQTEIDEETGEMSPTLVGALNALQESGRSVAAWTLNMTAQVKAIKEHEEAVRTRRKRLEARIEWAKGYLTQAMRETGTSAFEAVDGTFSVRLYPDRDESVQIADGVELPDALCRIKTVREPDKALIRAAIEAGEPVPAGVEIVRRDRLTIK